MESWLEGCIFKKKLTFLGISTDELIFQQDLDDFVSIGSF